MEKKYSELFETLAQLEKDLEATFLSNVARIIEFAEPRKDFGLIETIPINREERITHVTHDFRLWADNYDEPEKSKYVSLSYLSYDHQLELIRELEKIESKDDLFF